jgi:hypothetical protein
MPLHLRARFLAEWQSGIEVNRLLSLKWADLGELASSPLKVSFTGRKKHRKEYFTYMGRDTISALRSLERRNAYVFAGKLGTVQNPAWLGAQLKDTAERLMGERLIDRYDLGSWHSHAFMASFKTTAEHDKVDAIAICRIKNCLRRISVLHRTRDILVDLLRSIHGLR